MRFYVVTWRDDSLPENVGFEFCRTKREAEKLQKEHSPRSSPCQSCYEWLNDGDPPIVKPGERCPKCNSYNEASEEEAEVEVLNFTGTHKQQTWKALCYQVIQ